MWLGSLAIALKALSASKFRSFLTIISITIGCFAIVFMSSLAEGGLSTLKHGIEELGGARLVLISPKEPERVEGKKASYPRGFTRRDVELIFTALPHVVDRSLYAGLRGKDVTADNEEVTRADLVAADSRFFDVYKMSLLRGRAFSEEENRQHSKVCVVGHTLAAHLWSGSPIDRKLTVNGVRCLVIGEIADNDRLGIEFGFDWVNLVVIPGETVADVDPTARLEASIMVKTDDPRSNDVVKRIINVLLDERHHHIDDFTIFDFSSIMETFASVFMIMEIIVGIIAGIALFIGGIGVMNMMLVNVSERVREIGIRKALGATPDDISAQFLCEALLLSSFGGLLGAASGALATLGASAVIGGFLPTWIGAVSSSAVVVGVLASVSVGAVFGYLPARRASRLDPVEAIRR